MTSRTFLSISFFYFFTCDQISFAVAFPDSRLLLTRMACTSVYVRR